MILQNSSMMDLKTVKYEAMRDYALGVANQKLQMSKPTPMDIGIVDRREDQVDTEEEWINVVSGQKCYNCVSALRNHVEKEVKVKEEKGERI